MNLPPVRYLQAGPLAPEAGMAAAIAPAQAMGEFSKVFDGLGEKGFQIAKQVREIDEDRKTSRFFADMEKETARLQRETAKGDPQEALAAWKEKSAELPGRLGELGLSREGRARAEQRLIDWRGRRDIDFEKQAYVQGVEPGLASKATVIRGYQKAGDFARAEEEIHYTPEALANAPEKQKLHEENRALEARKNLLDSAGTHPHETLALVNQPDFAAKNPRVGKATIGEARKLAAQRVVANGLGYIDRFKKGVTEGVYFLADQVDEHFPAASAGLKKVFKEVLEPETPEGSEAFAALPKQDQAIIAELAQGMRSWRPEARDFDVRAFELYTKADQLREGPAKVEMQRALERMRAGKLEQAESAVDLVRRDLDRRFDPEGLGLATRSKDAGKLQAEGLLGDVTKLQTRGFSPEQAREIAAIKDPAGQLGKFREHSKNRPYPDETAGWDRKAFEVVMNQDGRVAYEDEKLKQAYGAAKEELEEWITFYPEEARDRAKGRAFVQSWISGVRTDKAAANARAMTPGTGQALRRPGPTPRAAGAGNGAQQPFSMDQLRRKPAATADAPKTGTPEEIIQDGN